MKANLAVVLGAVIYTERTSRQITQADIAASSGLHPMSISKIERGICLDVGVDTLRRVAEVFGMNGSELLARAEKWRDELGDRNEKLAGAAMAAVISLGRTQ